MGKSKTWVINAFDNPWPGDCEIEYSIFDADGLDATTTFPVKLAAPLSFKLNYLENVWDPNETNPYTHTFTYRARFVSAPSIFVEIPIKIYFYRACQYGYVNYAATVLEHLGIIDHIVNGLDTQVTYLEPSLDSESDNEVCDFSNALYFIYAKSADSN